MLTKLFSDSFDGRRRIDYNEYFIHKYTMKYTLRTFERKKEEESDQEYTYKSEIEFSKLFPFNSIRIVKQVRL